jgi:hypothetical protein
MAKVSDAFPSRFLKASDLPEGRDVIVTIEKANVEDIGQGTNKDRKIVLGFKGKDKELVCNKTNANSISKIYGDETEDWIGKPISLFVMDVEYQGDLMPAIRVRPRAPAPAGARSESRGTGTPAPQAPAPRPAPVAAPAASEWDADVPF